MSDRPNLGDVLRGIGRIDDDAVARALEYQREHGGYFGEALSELGVLSRQEVEWGLASQFGLPYIFPDPASIDATAAALVTAEWALVHRALPILVTDESLTVVVDSPNQEGLVQDLAARVDRRIDLALAPSDQIRELIRQVFSREPPAQRPGGGGRVSIDEALVLTLDAASRRFGVSVRDARATFWYEDGDRRQLRLLTRRWRSELEALMTPALADVEPAGTGPPSRARLDRDGMVATVEVAQLAAAGGHEILFRLVERGGSAGGERGQAMGPDADLLAEVRLLARAGAARFWLVTAPDELATELLPALPGLLLDPTRRGVHLGGEEDLSDGLSVRLPDHPVERRRTLSAVQSFRFDVVTAALTSADPEVVRDVLDLASVVFVSGPLDAREAYAGGIRWILRAERRAGAPHVWSLTPLHS